jgi:hypothetical protein
MGISFISFMEVPLIGLKIGAVTVCTAVKTQQVPDWAITGNFVDAKELPDREADSRNASHGKWGFHVHRWLRFCTGKEACMKLFPWTALPVVELSLDSPD